MRKTCDAIKAMSNVTKMMMMVMIAIDKKEFSSFALISTSMLWRLGDILNDCTTECHQCCRHSLANMKLQRNLRFFSFNFSELSFLCLPSGAPLLSEVIQTEELWLHLFHASSSSSYAKMFACEKSIRYGHHDVYQTKKNEHSFCKWHWTVADGWWLCTMHQNVVALSRPSPSELRWFLFIFALFDSPPPLATLINPFEWFESGKTGLAEYFICLPQIFIRHSQIQMQKERIFNRKSSGYGLTVRYSTDWADRN